MSIFRRLLGSVPSQDSTSPRAPGGRRQLPATDPVPVARHVVLPQPNRTSTARPVVLGFTDGSTAALAADDPRARALHLIAEDLRRI